MTGFRALLVSVLAASVFFGCSQQSPVSTVEQPTGQVSLTLKLGKVGSLAKATKVAAITLDSLTLDFTASGEASIHQVILISGNDQQVVTTTVELAAGKNWTVNVRTYDDAQPWNQVHYGSTSFDVVEGSNPPVGLTLSARYSMLMVRVNPVPDSSTYMLLAPGNDRTMMWMTWDDTSYVKGAKPATDTVKLYHDWLNVTDPMMPNPQDIQVVIRGTWNGTSNVDLYWGTLNIPTILAGVDASYSFSLNWIGPSSTTSQVQIDVTVGKVGMITVDGTPINP
jgi:hypothetical protein